MVLAFKNLLELSFSQRLLMIPSSAGYDILLTFKLERAQNIGISYVPDKNRIELVGKGLTVVMSSCERLGTRG